jgi:molybdenum cofactor synthesis domain-containing protein
MLVAALESHGAVGVRSVVTDERAEIVAAIHAAVASGVDAVITTGGTGVGPRDVTPEATATLIAQDLPGIPELLRQRDAERSPLVALSRARAGLTAPPQRVLVVNLPGSPSAVASALEVLPSLIAHTVHTSRGGDH